MNPKAFKEKEWYFYMVRCCDDSLYSGIATDVDDRIKEHNRGAGAKYTSGRRPVMLVYREKFDNVSQARKREWQIKTWPRAKKESLILGFPRLRSE